MAQREIGIYVVEVFFLSEVVYPQKNGLYWQGLLKKEMKFLANPPF